MDDRVAFSTRILPSMLPTVRRTLALTFAAAALLASPTGHANGAPPDAALWSFIASLRTAVNQGTQEVEDLLPVIPQTAYDGDLFTTLQAGPFDLDPDYRVEFVGYRVPKLRPLTVEKLQLQLDGDCVRLRAVQRQYGKVRLSQMPRGGLIHEQTYYSVTDAQGTIGFGFPEHRRYCVQNVVILPRGAKPPAP